MQSDPLLSSPSLGISSPVWAWGRWVSAPVSLSEPSAGINWELGSYLKDLLRSPAVLLTPHPPAKTKQLYNSSTTLPDPQATIPQDVFTKYSGFKFAISHINIGWWGRRHHLLFKTRNIFPSITAYLVLRASQMEVYSIKRCMLGQ